MAAATGIISQARGSAEHRFFLGMTIALAVVVFVGFSRSFFLSPLFPGWPAPPERFFALHGTAFAAWFALLLVQASLVSAGQLAWHRRLGVAGACLAAVMVVLGTRGALIAAGRSTGFVGVAVPPLSFLAIPLFSMVLFAVFVTLAILKRADRQSHKRYMLIASVSMIAAAFARWPVVRAGGPLAFFACTDLFLVALLVWDLRSRGRVHPVTAWAGGATLLSEPIQLAVAFTPAWLGFARWAIGLVG